SPVTAACYACFSVNQKQEASPSKTADSRSQPQHSDIINKNIAVVRIYNNILKLAEIGKDSAENRRFSKKVWPIRGGGVIGENKIGECEDFLITGYVHFLDPDPITAILLIRCR
uniref:Uncharacterized protein n=1 Tax=Romanomermis culicivorax TaxID=13658 RepID=A0A915K1U2_ROMCU